jgi:ABC-type microcin C transport system duplicated ATPase subunit YejF
LNVDAGSLPTVPENLDVGGQPPRRFDDGAPAPTWTPEKSCSDCSRTCANALIVEQMIDTIQALKQEGLAILLCGQNMAFARLVSGRAYLIEKGRCHGKDRCRSLPAISTSKAPFSSCRRLRCAVRGGSTRRCSTESALERPAA